MHLQKKKPVIDIFSLLLPENTLRLLSSIPLYMSKNRCGACEPHRQKDEKIANSVNNSITAKTRACAYVQKMYMHMVLAVYQHHAMFTTVTTNHMA